METLVTIFYICVCVLLFSFAIAIHEFGHFLVALKLGLRVEAFSIGFGPVLWKRTVRGVEYRLSAIPLGGYVSIPDVDPEGTKALEGASGEEGPRARIPAWKEILVAVAGPFMNIVLAVVLSVVLACIPSAKFGELPAKIGGILPNGPAATAGLKAGDVVTEVGGRAVRTWTDLQTEVQIAGGQPVAFKVLRPLSHEHGKNDETCTCADCAQPKTDGIPLEFRVTPARNETTGAWYIMALSVTNESGAVSWMPARNPLRQLAWDAGSIFRVLKGLVTPREAKATSQALGGPVLIAEGLYRQVRRDKWDGLGFLRFLNVNLAILNLLPIPVLDGGLILFSLIALVFRRRLPDFIVKHISMAFMVLLMGLMGVLILRDSWRSYKIHTYKPAKGDEIRTSQQETPHVQTNADARAEGR